MIATRSPLFSSSKEVGRDEQAETIVEIGVGHERTIALQHVCLEIGSFNIVAHRATAVVITSVFSGKVFGGAKSFGDHEFAGAIGGDRHVFSETFREPTPRSVGIVAGVG